MIFSNKTILNNKELNMCYRIFYFIIDKYTLIGKTMATVLVLIYAICNITNSEWKIVILVGILILIELLIRPFFRDTKTNEFEVQMEFYEKYIMIQCANRNNCIYYKDINKIIYKKDIVFLIADRLLVPIKEKENEKFNDFLTEKINV